ncbi:hypothetical protein [Streptomyces sp. SAI-229]|uniref:hypothetical protein n=1 Tax=Streptomyces sp. SAI-229 TaxID=3377731 RepID=UPI003C79A39E
MTIQSTVHGHTCPPTSGRRNDVRWLTAAIGRSPVTESHLLEVGPKTLEIKADHTPPVTDTATATGTVEAVHGVAVDDEHNTMWTTNTRDNSVSVCSRRTGERPARLSARRPASSTPPIRATTGSSG